MRGRAQATGQPSRIARRTAFDQGLAPRMATRELFWFLAGIASCGVELVQALARDQGLPLRGVKVAITGMMDRANPVRPDVSVFNAVALKFELSGVSQADGDSLIERFRGR